MHNLNDSAIACQARNDENKDRGSNPPSDTYLTKEVKNSFAQQTETLSPRLEVEGSDTLLSTGERVKGVLPSPAVVTRFAHTTTPSPKEGYKAAFTLAEVFHPAEQARKIAFTLAEVLITLGIIGIVAALTIPSLIQHHKKAETSARLKKFYSAMSQAILLSEIDNGLALDWQYPSYVGSDWQPIPAEDNKKASLTYFNKYLAIYLKYVSIDENAGYTESDNIARYIKVSLADSSYFYMKVGACIDLRFDVNGDKTPNKDGRDLYTFVICSKSNAQYHCAGKPFCPYGYGVYYNNRTAARNDCARTANTCATMLLLDNWEFKEDYPFKL